MTSNQIINISSATSYEECKNKCDLNFRYPISSCVATNGGFCIGINYDTTSVPPVVFNTIKYNVSNSPSFFSIELLTPSIHLFNGNYTDAELVIMHTSESGGTLYICIPISSTGVISPATTTIQQIINSVSANAPNKSQKTTVNLPDFSLQKIVPSKPYYSFSFNNEGSNVVIYGIENAIGLDADTLKKMKSFITSSTGVYTFGLVVGNPSIYKNSSGPNSNSDEDQIYIDCKPVNESEETTDVKIRVSETVYDIGDWFKMILNSVLFQCVIIIAILLLLLYGIKYTAMNVSKS
jgi:hypothetical protein